MAFNEFLHCYFSFLDFEMCGLPAFQYILSELLDTTIHFLSCALLGRGEHLTLTNAWKWLYVTKIE